MGCSPPIRFLRPNGEVGRPPTPDARQTPPLPARRPCRPSEEGLSEEECGLVALSIPNTSPSGVALPDFRRPALPLGGGSAVPDPG